MTNYPQIAYAPGYEVDDYNVIFSGISASATSHEVSVFQNPFVVTAYGLITGEKVEVWRIFGRGAGTSTELVVINGRPVQLTPTNNLLVLDISGRYLFKLTGRLGLVTVAGHYATVVNKNASMAQPI